MLGAIRSSPQGIKEEISMVRKEAVTQFLEPDGLKMNKRCIGFTLLEILLALLGEGLKQQFFSDFLVIEKNGNEKSHTER